MTLNENKNEQIQEYISDLLVTNQLFLVYQPQVDIRTGHIFCAEALLRWPDLKVSPEKIINAIEKNFVLMRQVSAWVLQEACNQILINKKDDKEISIAINLSAQNLVDDFFINTMFLNIIKQNKVPPFLIEVELTETFKTENFHKLNRNLKVLQKHGIKTVLDDFGIKFNSLNVLYKLPFNKVKIDKIFIDGLKNNLHVNRSFTLSIIELLKSQHLEFIAEGVETFEVAAYLENHGCYNMQGYLVGKPTREFPKWNKLIL